MEFFVISKSSHSRWDFLSQSIGVTGQSTTCSGHNNSRFLALHQLVPDIGLSDGQHLRPKFHTQIHAKLTPVDPQKLMF